MSTTPEMPSSGLVVVEHSGTAEHGHVNQQQQQHNHHHHHLQQQQQHQTHQQVLVNEEYLNAAETTLVTTAGGHYITSSGEIISNGQILKFVSEEEAALIEQQQHHHQQHHHSDDHQTMSQPQYVTAQHHQPQPPHTITVNGPKVQLINSALHLAKASQQQQQQQTINYVHHTTNKSSMPVNSFTYVTTPIANKQQQPQQQQQQSTVWSQQNKMVNGVPGGITYKTIGGGQLHQQQQQPPIVHHVLKTTGGGNVTKVVSAAQQRSAQQRTTTVSTTLTNNTIHLNAASGSCGGAGGAPMLVTTTQLQAQSSQNRNAGVATQVPMVGAVIQQQQPIQKHLTMGMQQQTTGGTKIVRGGKAGNNVVASTFKMVTSTPAQTGRAIKTIPPHHMAPVKGASKAAAKFSAKQYNAAQVPNAATMSATAGQPRNVHIQQQQQPQQVVGIGQPSAVAVPMGGVKGGATRAVAMPSQVHTNVGNVYIQGAVQRVNKTTKYIVQQQQQPPVQSVTGQILVGHTTAVHPQQQQQQHQQHMPHLAYQQTVLQQQQQTPSGASTTTTHVKLSTQLQQPQAQQQHYPVSAAHFTGSASGTIKYVNGQGNVVAPPSRMRAILQQSAQQPPPQFYGSAEHLAESMPSPSAAGGSRTGVPHNHSSSSSSSTTVSNDDGDLLSEEMSARILQSLSQKSVYNNNNNSNHNHNNALRYQQQQQQQQHLHHLQQQHQPSFPAGAPTHQYVKSLAPSPQHQQIVYVTNSQHQNEYAASGSHAHQQYLRRTSSAGSQAAVDVFGAAAAAARSHKYGPESFKVKGDTSTMSSPPFETLAIGHVQQHYQHQQQQSSAVTMTSITIGGHAATDDDDIIGEEVRPGPIVAQMDDRLKVLFAVLQDHTYGLQSKQQLQQLLATAAAASAAAAAATAQAAASSAVPVTPTAASRSVDGKIVGGYQTSSVSYAPVQMSPSHQNQPPHPSKSASFAFGSSSSSVGGSRINDVAEDVQTAVSSGKHHLMVAPTVQAATTTATCVPSSPPTAITVGLAPTVSAADLADEETDTAPEGEGFDDSITRCICDLTHDDGYMICCDKCSAWQHVDCMGIDRLNIPDEYHCEVCQPRPVDRLRARSVQLLKRKEQQHFLLLNNPGGLTPVQLAATTPLPIDGLPAHIALAQTLHQQQQQQQALGGAAVVGAAASAAAATTGDVLSTPVGTVAATSAGLLNNNAVNNNSPSAAAASSTVTSTTTPTTITKTGKAKSSSAKQRKSNAAATSADSTNPATVAGTTTTPAAKAARKRNDSATRATPANGAKRRETAKKSGGSASAKRRSGKQANSAAANASMADADSNSGSDKQTPAALKQWIENYEQAMTNHYSPELRARLQAIHKQQQTLPPQPPHPHLRNLHHLEAGKCTTVPHAGGKILISMLDLPPQRPIIEVHGKFMLSQQYKPTTGAAALAATGRLPGPFLFFYRLPPNEVAGNSNSITEVCVDTRTFGNDARFVRRSCRPNAEILHTVEKGAIHLYIVSLTLVKSSTEITVRHEPHDLEGLTARSLSQPTSTICACGLTKDCLFTVAASAAPPAPPVKPVAAATTPTTTVAPVPDTTPMSPVTPTAPVSAITDLPMASPTILSPTSNKLAPLLMQAQPQQPPSSAQPLQQQYQHRLNGSSAAAALLCEDSGMAVTPVATPQNIASHPAAITTITKPCYKRNKPAAQSRHRSTSNSSSCSSEIAAASGMLSPSHHSQHLHQQQQHLTYPNPHPFTAPHLLHSSDGFGGGVFMSSATSGAPSPASSVAASPPVSMMASPSLPSPLAGQVVITSNVIGSPPGGYQSTMMPNHHQHQQQHQQLQLQQQQQYQHHQQQPLSPYPALPGTPTRLDDSSASVKLVHHSYHHNHHNNHNHINQQQQQQHQHHLQLQHHSTMHAITQQANDLPPATIHLVPAMPKSIVAPSPPSTSSTFSALPPSVASQLSISTTITTATSAAAASPILPPATLSLVMPTTAAAVQHQQPPKPNSVVVSELSVTAVQATAAPADVDTIDGPAAVTPLPTMQPAMIAAPRPATLVLNELTTTETLAESPNPMQMAEGGDTPLSPITPITPLKSPIHRATALASPLNKKAASPRKLLGSSSSIADGVTEAGEEATPTKNASLSVASTTTATPSTAAAATAAPAATATKESKKMTREERKMQAIMRAFEKMEKNQQRKQELNKSKGSTPTTPLAGTGLGSPTLSSSAVPSITTSSNTPTTNDGSGVTTGLSATAVATSGTANDDQMPIFGSPTKRSATTASSSNTAGSGSQRKKKRKGCNKSYQASSAQQRSKQQRARNRLISGGDSDGSAIAEALPRSPSSSGAVSAAAQRPVAAMSSANHVHSLHGSHPYAAEYGDDDGDDDNDHHAAVVASSSPSIELHESVADTVAAAGMLMSLAAQCVVGSAPTPVVDDRTASSTAATASSAAASALALSSACLLVEAAVGPFEPQPQQQQQQLEFKMPPKTKTKKTIMNEWLHQSIGSNHAVNSDLIATQAPQQQQQQQPCYEEPPPQQPLCPVPQQQSTVVAYTAADIGHTSAPMSLAAQRIEEFIHISSGGGHNSPLLESKWPIMQTPANLLHAGEYPTSALTTAPIAPPAVVMTVPPAAPTPPMQCGSSVKKRWLRQAISEECSDDLTAPGSPPNGYMTPLKKRRMARECSAAAASAALTDSCPIGQQAVPRYDQLPEIVTNEHISLPAHSVYPPPTELATTTETIEQYSPVVRDASCDSIDNKPPTLFIEDDAKPAIVPTDCASSVADAVVMDAKSAVKILEPKIERMEIVTELPPVKVDTKEEKKIVDHVDSMFKDEPMPCASDSTPQKMEFVETIPAKQPNAFKDEPIKPHTERKPELVSVAVPMAVKVEDVAPIPLPPSPPPPPLALTLQIAAPAVVVKPTPPTPAPTPAPIVCMADEFDIKPLEACDVIELVVPPVSIAAAAAAAANVKPSEFADIQQRLHSFHNANLMILQSRNKKKHSRATTPTLDEDDSAASSACSTPEHPAQLKSARKSTSSASTSPSSSASAKKRRRSGAPHRSADRLASSAASAPPAVVVATDAFDIKPLDSVTAQLATPLHEDDVDHVPPTGLATAAVTMLPAFLSSIASPTSVATVTFNLTQPPPPPPPPLPAAEALRLPATLVTGLPPPPPPPLPPLPASEPLPQSATTAFYQHSHHLHHTTFPEVVSQLPASLAGKSMLSEYLENPNKPPQVASAVSSNSAAIQHDNNGTFNAHSIFHPAPITPNPQQAYATSLIDGIPVAAIPTPPAAIAPATSASGGVSVCVSASAAAAAAASLLMPSPTCTKIVTRTQCNDPRLNPILAQVPAPPTPKRKLSINEYRKRKLQSSAPTTPTGSSTSATSSPADPLSAATSNSRRQLLMKPASRSSLLDGPALPLDSSPMAATDSPVRFENGLTAAAVRLNGSHSSSSGGDEHNHHHRHHPRASVFSPAPTLLEQQQENLSLRLKNYKSLSSSLLGASADISASLDKRHSQLLHNHHHDLDVGLGLSSGTAAAVAAVAAATGTASSNVVHHISNSELLLLSSKLSAASGGSSRSSLTSISSTSTTPERCTTPVSEQQQQQQQQQQTSNGTAMDSNKHVPDALNHK